MPTTICRTIARRLTAALINFAAHYAAGLAAVGVRRGDPVAVLMNSHRVCVAFVHALARLGALLVPLNTRLTPDELRYQFDVAGCRFAICDHSNEDKTSRLRNVYSVGSLINPTTMPFPIDVSNQNLYLDGEFDLDTVQSIVFTSGTTGKPKGAPITFGNLYHSALASAERLGAPPDDRWLCPLPFYHVGGLSIIFRSALYGSAIMLPYETNHPLVDGCTQPSSPDHRFACPDPTLSPVGSRFRAAALAAPDSARRRGGQSRTGRALP